MSGHDPVYDTQFKSRYLHPRYWPTWLAIALLWLLAWMPARARDAVASAFAPLLVTFAKKQCYIARTNIRLCFPDLSDAEVEAMLLQSIRAGLMAFFAYGEWTARSRDYLQGRFKVHGREHIDACLAENKQIIFMIPHTWAIDAGGLYLTSLGMPMCTMMHSAKNEVFDWFMTRQRTRFNGIVYERDAGIKAIIKTIRDGKHFFYLPDQDHGREASIFVPFFAEMKATLPALPKLVKLTGARVLPVLSVYNSEAHRYELVIRPPMDPYPTPDLTADTRAMNAEIEALLSEWPEQYMWFLKYFQTQVDSREGRYEAGIRKIRRR
ncbi:MULTISPECIES: lauroyl-Kdo(2)-lipid IV(A) myristoyltransferase [Oceanimonas]|uniref:Lipid A biosynthesis acyltransferase n=1 Tax=Oceanimonas doudoroffii TaxID=84158 RepID=A0A233RH19_9GAMM|nr:MULTISPECIES: lauroyl-Kdo(2)-lipid IV(A) myristoyltransferase [Oceanimonas]NHI00738.1 Lipid A biosynthesis myristoyltransferase [Oceanimonas sp. MB9]OXY82679.1 lauroyl-Kdo(2)-lipid IV(A) myristoyltransferase [Oceanimonas doudoroffii]